MRYPIGAPISQGYTTSMAEGTILSLIVTYRYWILFPVACFEGPVTAFVIGTLAALGYFNVWISLCILLLGDIVPDAAYYFIGKFGERASVTKKYLAKVGIGERELEVIRNLWHKHAGKTMFFSKLAYGLSTAFLISAGLVGMPFGRFFSYALLVTVAQYGILMFLGYHFSNALSTVSSVLEHIQYLFAGVVVVAVAYYYFTRYMRTKLLAEKKEEEQEESEEKLGGKIN